MSEQPSGSDPIAGAPAERANPNRMKSPIAFWIGMAIITAATAVVFWEFLRLKAEGAGYRVTPAMGVGVVVDVLGTLLAAWGVLPRGWWEHYDSLQRRDAEAELERVASDMAAAPAEADALQAMDNSRMTPTHWTMVGRMYLGLVVDTMKPATLGFMLPGMRAEYGLSASTVALFPLFALIGLTLGSVVFGALGDIIGRRASFIFTALLFATTSLCGFMPWFQWQLGMCFLMGLAAGGELPLLYTLLAESMPARHRGWLGVALGGIGALSGFFVASTLAWILEPPFSWRILWLPNLPTALLMLFMLRWIPESPRFLLQMGFPEEAKKVLAKLGITHGASAKPEQRRQMREVFGRGLVATTVMLCAFGFSWGLCNWGFITWLPNMLRDLGVEAAQSSKVLAVASAGAIPGTIVASAAFGLWSSKWTAALSALATSGCLVAFYLFAPILATRTDLLMILMICLFVASSSMIGVLAPYSVELYPTTLRGVGSGVVAASSKSGGIVGPLLVGWLLGMSSSLALPALIIGIPIGLAGVLMMVRGRETRGVSLEELTDARPPS
ncbi:MAG: MFS transporter [Myxococcales bacterium]|nr:MFS transporter [Myxococcales bacterium]